MNFPPVVFPNDPSQEREAVAVTNSASEAQAEVKSSNQQQEQEPEQKLEDQEHHQEQQEILPSHSQASDLCQEELEDQEHRRQPQLSPTPSVADLSTANHGSSTVAPTSDQSQPQPQSMRHHRRTSVSTSKASGRQLSDRERRLVLPAFRRRVFRVCRTIPKGEPCIFVSPSWVCWALAVVSSANACVFVDFLRLLDVFRHGLCASFCVGGSMG